MFQIIMVEVIIKIDIDQIMDIEVTSFRGRGQYRQSYRGRSCYDNNYRNDFRRDDFQRCTRL